jgi:type II secretory pathway component PulC
MKKLNFNFKFLFKFLERFKKTKTIANEDAPNDETENNSDSDSDSEINETSNFQTMTKSNIQSVVEKTIEDDDFSDENPEEFVEKTLTNFNLEKFREENQHILNDNLSEQEITDNNINFNNLPGKPKTKTRFSFKFPKFGKNKIDKQVGERLTFNAPLKSFDKLNWNDFILKLFSPYSRKKIHSVFTILLLVTFTYLFGKSAALFLGRSTPMTTNVSTNITIPIEKADTSLQDLNRISSTNLFNIKESDKAGIKKEIIDIASIICVDAEKPTSEPLVLRDTIVLQDSVKSVASVQIRGAAELINVREGEKLNDSVEVSKINRMKVILKNLSTGECEYVATLEENTPLMMPKMNVLSSKRGQAMLKITIPEIKNSGNSFKIKRSFRDKLISNMSEVLTQAKAIQITNPDGSLSFKMTEVVPGSVYANLDIQNDDIISSINGKKIENLNELMGLLGRIKEIDQFQIGLKRNGIEKNLDYGFE